MRYDIELARILACFGVVCFHSGQIFPRDVSYSGLIIFLIFTAFFATKSSRTHSFVQRAQKLLVPYAFWYFIYAGFSLVKGTPVYPENYGLVGKVLASPSIHLWYLPFCFICVLLIDTAKRITSNNILTLFSLAGFIGLLASSYLWRQWSLATPLGQYLHAMPGIFLGIVLAGVFDKTVKIKSFLSLALILTMIIIYPLNIVGISLTYCLGIAAGLLLLSKHSLLPVNRWIALMSGLTFGIYLAHPLVLFVLQYIGIHGPSFPIIGFLVTAVGIYVTKKWLPQWMTQRIM